MFENIILQNNKLSFDIHDIDVSIANAIRRVILAEIPTVAVSFDAYNIENNDVRILTNTTSLHNEFMSHRLSLIPLYMSADEIDNYDPKKYTFKISKKNTSNKNLVITSKDIIVYDEEKKSIDDTLSKRMFPPDPITHEHILITILKPNNYNQSIGEEFVAEFKARMGIAKKHARWCPVSTCTYFNIIDEKKASHALDQYLKTKSFANEDDKIKFVNNFNILEKQRHFIKNIYDEPSAFTFTIESECMLSPTYLVSKALQILISKLENMANTVDIQCIHDSQNLFMLQVDNEDHTLGNLYQSLIYNMYVREKRDVEFIGYFQPHPLEQYIVFKVKFLKSMNENDVKEFVKSSCSKLVRHINEILEAWSRHTVPVDKSKKKSKNISTKKAK